MKQANGYHLPLAGIPLIWSMFITAFLTPQSGHGQIIFQDNFVTGTFGTQWTPRPDDSPQGIVAVATTLGNTYVPYEGQYGVALGLQSDNNTTAINALDLRLDLSAYAGKRVELSFWFKDNNNGTYDENQIAFSDNGGNTFHPTNYFPLKTGAYPDEWGQFPPIDIAKVSGLALTSNFVIRFQQRGTQDFNSINGGVDGFLIDNVLVRVSPVQYATLPFIDDFEETTLKNNWRWANPFFDGATVADPDLSRPDGVVAPLSSFGITQFDPCSGSRVLAIGKRYDDPNTSTFVANALDLHLNLLNQPQAELRFCIQDLDAPFNADIVGIFFSNNGGLTFKKVYALKFNQWTDDVWGELPPIDIDLLAAANGMTLTDKFIIRFQARFSRDFNPTNGRQGVLIDSVRVLVPDIQYATPPFFDNFESGTLSKYYHWSDAFLNGMTISDQDWVRPNGLVGVYSSYGGVNFPAKSGTQVLALGLRQDIPNTYYNVNAVDLHLNLKGTSGFEFRMCLRDYNDATNDQDAIYFSDNGGATFKNVMPLTPGIALDDWQEYKLSIDQRCSAFGLSKTDKFVIRIQQRGQGDFNSTGFDDGFIIDNINVCIPPTVVGTGINTTCNQPNGSATVNDAGPGATYLWSNGKTTRSIDGLASGTYTVTVTAVDGCTASTSVTIASSFSPPTVNSIVTPNSSCVQPNGKISLIVIGINSPFTYDWGIGQPMTKDLSNLAPGTYMVTVTDSKGCTTSTSIVVTGPLPFSVNIIPDDATIQQGQTITLCANGPANATYNWSNGATTKCINVTTGGTYSVTVTANGCTATDAILVKTVTSADNLTDEYKVTLSPNPAMNMLRVHLNPAAQAEVERWSIVSTDGRLIQSEIVRGKAGVIEVPVGNLPPGMYQLHLHSARGAWSGTFVKQ